MKLYFCLLHLMRIEIERLLFEQGWNSRQDNAVWLHPIPVSAAGLPQERPACCVTVAVRCRAIRRWPAPPFRQDCRRPCYRAHRDRARPDAHPHHRGHPVPIAAADGYDENLRSCASRRAGVFPVRRHRIGISFQLLCTIISELGHRGLGGVPVARAVLIQKGGCSAQPS